MTQSTTAAPIETPLRPRLLTRDECTGWLAVHREGRLGYTGGRGPRACVVRYALVGDMITLRVPDYNDIAHFAPGELVSLVVEGRPETHGAYESVNVLGVAELIGGDQTSPAEDDQLEAWPAHVATKVIRFPITSVSGVAEEPSAAADRPEARS